MTLAHPMAVLPLRGFGLPTTALVIGSMVPDVSLFANWKAGYDLAHSLPGIVTIDLVLATALTAVWYLAVREAVVDMAPHWVRSRLHPRVLLTAREWLSVPGAACVGAATHLFWDSFTHVGRWGPRHIDWLAQEHDGTLGLKWVQYFSGGIGLVVVTVVAVRYLRTLDPLPGRRERRVLPAACLPAVVLAALLVGVVAVARHSAYGFVGMAFEGVVRSLIALAAFGALTCAAWHVARATRAVKSPA